MAVFGYIDEFRPGNEMFSMYMERVKLFFLAANKIKDNSKVPLSLTVIGVGAYDVLQNFTAPSMPYADLVAELKKHYKPKTLVVA